MSIKRQRTRQILTEDEIILQVTNPAEYKMRALHRREQLRAMKSKKKTRKKLASSSLWCVPGGLPSLGKR